MEIRSLADVAHLLAPAAQLRWQEWGNEPGHEGLDWWIQTTTAEVGRRLPASWVAISKHEAVLDVVGVAEFDFAERRDRSPWVLGMVVAKEARRQGIGRDLLRALEDHVGSIGLEEVWVATSNAREFYSNCGYAFVESLVRADENRQTNVMVKSLGLKD